MSTGGGPVTFYGSIDSPDRRPGIRPGPAAEEGRAMADTAVLRTWQQVRSLRRLHGLACTAVGSI